MSPQDRNGRVTSRVTRHGIGRQHLVRPDHRKAAPSTRRSAPSPRSIQAAAQCGPARLSAICEFRTVEPVHAPEVRRVGRVGSTHASFDEICASIFAGSASSLQVGSRPPTSRSRSIAARRRERSTISGWNKNSSSESPERNGPDGKASDRRGDHKIMLWFKRSAFTLRVNRCRACVARPYRHRERRAIALRGYIAIDRVALPWHATNLTDDPSIRSGGIS